MSKQVSHTSVHQRHSSPFGILAAIVFFIASGTVSYWNIQVLDRNTTRVTRSYDIIGSLDEVQSLIKDAETGQRGYVITGNDRYLEPFNDATNTIDVQMNRLQELIADDAEQKVRMTSLRNHAKAKFDELHQTVDLRRNHGFEAAQEVVLTDRGKNDMDAIRKQIGDMQRQERELRDKRLEEMAGAYRVAVTSGILSAFLGVALAVAIGLMMQRSERARARQQWLQSGQLGLSEAIAGEQDVTQLGNHLLSFLARNLDAHAGAFYIRGDKGYEKKANYGIPAEASIPASFKPGEGLLGQVARDGSAVVIRDVPDDYLTLGSALGQGKPRQLVIAPTRMDGGINAVIELGFVHPMHPLTLEFLEQISEPLGVAVRSADYRAHLQNFLEETQRQSEELQAQSEELRVSNEELEEQSRALKESQTRLEQQQVEMEQNNAQLEEQAQILERQKEDLAYSNATVHAKAQELEQASRYKSDFLANMSHELRTPLNSSLILSKLLADNRDGNLTEEQVNYARTIQSSGNDLLTLINDILDLSKIEAGHMEIHPQRWQVSRIADDMHRMFDPIAEQKGVRFLTDLENAPASLETDPQRLEQILKNLLSNAFKFTERGQVTLSITARAPDHIALSVVDTGIGISEEQQQAVFEAFRQADGTISRKYGGTGLGLSISRQLARLLGGFIELESASGKGSRFTLIIPQTFDAQNVQPRTPAPAALPDKPSESPAPKSISIKTVPDDRETLSGGRRIILVVEDDASFARILYDLAVELDFHCLIANHAEDALAMAKQYLPSAILLDVGLPDHSGLSVLDRLKRDARTRHIPVHVISANDHAQTALSLGAVGYMIKPVQREQLAATFRQLENRLEQRMRRILVVEDDETQRASVEKLLASQDVETVGVGTAAECLEALKRSTFDCMVLDLSLPDASGYSLLETLSQEDAYSFPPVIVYTGRDLSRDDEQKLRRYSKSIIIKGAKSPERLLDEVTLFLHQVVSELAPEQQRMLEKVRNRDEMLEGRHILIVEDDVRNIYALTSLLEAHGAILQIARNGLEALQALEKQTAPLVDMILMDVMMPEMDGLTATREIRKRKEWKKLPIIMLTAKAMRDDQERCLEAGANDYMAKPLDVEKLLSLVRVWMPR